MVKFEKTFFDKFLEKVPAMMTWGVIIFLFVGSYFIPNVVAILVIVFNIFFLYRSLAFSIQFVLSTLKLRAAEQINWQAKVEGLGNIDAEIDELLAVYDQIKQVRYEAHQNIQTLSNKYRSYGSLYKLPKSVQKLMFRIEKGKTLRFIKNQIEELRELQEIDIPALDDLNHVILIPHAKEPLKVLENTLNFIKNQTFPTKQIHIVLGAEKRDPEGIEKSEILKEKYKDVFGHVWVSIHELKEHEIVGKSSNMAAAGQVALEKINEQGWDKKLTTVTSCDADSRLPKEYFSYLSYQYLTRPDRHFKFYTGVILLYANIWRIDFFARVRNSLSSMYNVSKMVRPDKFIPFSTYSTSFWMVEQIGFWTPWVTPEDFHLFFKASFHFSSKVSAIPMFTRIYVDAAEGDNPWETFKNNYFQSRRWQWGVSDDGWVIKNLLLGLGTLHPMVYYRGLHVIMDHILAPTTSFLLTVGANLPPILNDKFGSTVFGAKLRGVSSTIMLFTLASLVVAIIFDSLLKPKRDGVSLFRKLITPLEWVVNPVVGLVLTSIPGLEAHTRLLFGKYLEYYITKKKA